MDWITENADALKAMNVPADRQALRQLLAKYPWFTSARLVLDGERIQPDKLLAAYLLVNPVPATRLKRIDGTDITVPEMIVTDVAQTPADDIIERFLSKGEHRIVPADDITDFDAASGSAVLEVNDGMATEELAEIYKKQGLDEKAEEIYRILKQNK